jgi:hypothetical protein
MGPGDGFTNLVNNLEKAVLTTAKTSKRSDFEKDIEEMFGAASRKNSQPAEALHLDSAGWMHLCKTVFRVSHSDCQQLFNSPSMTVTKQMEKYVTTDTLITAILGGGTQEERDGVLEAVWHKLTPNGETVLTPDLLICKKDGPTLAKPQGWRQKFLEYIAVQAGAAGSPVDFNIFSAYYHTLCQKCSHRHFVLMVVNAWHLMGGALTPSPTSPTGSEGVWSRVNTVNLRVRVFKNSDPNGGKIVTLWDDCGVVEGDYSDGALKSKLTIISDRLKAQMEAGITENFAFDGIDITGAV